MRDYLKIIAPLIGWLILMVVLLIGFSWQEARVFNKHTSSNVTTFDAIFVQLRIVEPINKEDSQ